MENICSTLFYRKHKHRCLHSSSACAFVSVFFTFHYRCSNTRIMTSPNISSTTSVEEMDVEMAPRASRIDSVAHTAHNPTRRNRLEYDFTKVEDLRDYLIENIGYYKEFHLQRLVGGTANHLYRLTECGEEREGKSKIFKHAAGQLASSPAFNLNPERMDFEFNILARLYTEAACRCTTADDFLISNIEKTHVHAVTPVHYERDIKLLCLQDSGKRNLKDAYAELSRDEVQEIGTELGKWLANLHGKTPKAYVTDPKYNDNKNNDVGVRIARYTYNRLSAVLKQYGYDETLGDEINAYFGALIEKDEECVCHGDFWPGNVMLQSNVPERGPYVVTVIDWEMVRVGNSATDVGQFAAEAFLLDKIYGDKGLRAAFIKAYFKTSAVNYGSKERLYPWMARIAIHFAVHIAVWPASGVHWANREDSRALVDLAVAILKDAATSSPNVMVWRIFDGLSGLDAIAEDTMLNPEATWPHPSS